VLDELGRLVGAGSPTVGLNQALGLT
jgi:hypothetical protein